MKTKNVNEVKGNKKHTGLVIVIAVFLAIILECCFNTNTYDDPESVSVDSVEKSIESETIKDNKTSTITETEVQKETETEVLSSDLDDDLLSEQGIYITPGSTYVTDAGGAQCDKVLYLNELYEDDNTRRFVGFADNNGKPDTSLTVDITMHKVDDTTWASDDNVWVANYFTDCDGIYFGQQSGYDSDFCAVYTLYQGESEENSSDEILRFTSDSEMRDFVRDSSNVGKVVYFEAYVYSANCVDGNMYVDAMWADGSKTECIKTSQQNCSANILDDDYVAVTGVYLGLDENGYVSFDSLSVDLLQM